jgi:hypothetical protein
MELTLTHKTDTQILVTCDGQPSHTFDLQMLTKSERPLRVLDDPVAYGKRLYQALFPSGTLAKRTIDQAPERILLISMDDDLNAIPWEYIYGPDGFIVLECHFVRGLPAIDRINSPTLASGLHILAVPANPLSSLISPLNTDGDWLRFKEIVSFLPFALTLERMRPPTVERLRNAVANQRHRVVHFVGQSGESENGTVLYFEKDNGDLDQVTAKQFALRTRGTIFLVTLNACISAMPGETSFNNFAANLIRQKVPYVLGMHFSIPDADAQALELTLYDELGRGSSVEEALFHARLALASSPHRWQVGVPALYTSLSMPAAGFTVLEGTPTIEEHMPFIEVSALPRATHVMRNETD